MADVYIANGSSDEAYGDELTKRIQQLGHNVVGSSNALKNSEKFVEECGKIITSDIVIATMPSDEYVDLCIGIAIGSGSIIMVMSDSNSNFKHYMNTPNFVKTSSVTDCIEVISKLAKTKDSIK